MMRDDNNEAEEAKVDTRVGQFIAVRDMIKKLEKEYSEKKKPYQELKDMLEGWLLAHMKKTGAESIRTKHGTCSSSTTYTASLADPKAFMDFVIAGGLWDLLDKRANAIAVVDYVKERQSLPPGVNLNPHMSAGVTRPRKKAADLVTGDSHVE
jgi:hypothetical protein